jgi:UPF0755 protein
MLNKLLIFSVILLVLVLSAFGFNRIYLSPVGTSDQTQIFVVPANSENFDTVKSLKDQNLIKNEKAFKFIMDYVLPIGSVSPGGYRLSQNMNAWQVLRKVGGKQDLFWVTTSHCLRKEQVGEELASVLGWSDAELARWNTVYTTTKPEYFEGVYYPDTYLMPADEPGSAVAKRYIDHFNEVIAPLLPEFAAKNIKWTTGIKIASLIAREAAGKEDMGLISGIIWNRLNTDMRLQIDATLAYTLGKNESGSWWRTIDIEQKQSDSPYNTYRREGLPPTPICSPGLDAIKAALNPEETDCLYYLHADKQIHCAKTYAEHLENIKTYLK